MTAVIETQEFEPNRGRRSTLTKVRPLIDGGSIAARIGVRSDPTSESTWKTAGSIRAGGRMPVRASGRYIRAELTLSGAWDDAIGIAYDREDVRPSGRRG